MWFFFCCAVRAGGWDRGTLVPTSVPTSPEKKVRRGLTFFSVSQPVPTSTPIFETLRNCRRQKENYRLFTKGMKKVGTGWDRLGTALKLKGNFCPNLLSQPPKKKRLGQPTTSASTLWKESPLAQTLSAA